MGFKIIYYAKGIAPMDWHIYRRGEQTGPIKDVDFLRMRSEKMVDREDLVWNQNMKDWIPGKQRGKPVPVKFLLPLEF